MPLAVGLRKARSLSFGARVELGRQPLRKVARYVVDSVNTNLWFSLQAATNSVVNGGTALWLGIATVILKQADDKC